MNREGRVDGRSILGLELEDYAPTSFSGGEERGGWAGSTILAKEDPE